MAVGEKRHFLISPKLRITVLFTTALLMAALVSCSGNHGSVYSRFVSVDPGGWQPGEYCVFAMSDADSASLATPGQLFDVILAVRHTTEYPYDNLWIVLENASLPDSMASSKVNLRLSEPSGSWRGKGIQGIYEFCDTVLTGADISPDDVLSIRHDMPVASLPGILDMGLIVIPSNKKN